MQRCWFYCWMNLKGSWTTIILSCSLKRDRNCLHKKLQVWSAYIVKMFEPIEKVGLYWIFVCVYACLLDTERVCVLIHYYREGAFYIYIFAVVEFTDSWRNIFCIIYHIYKYFVTIWVLIGINSTSKFLMYSNIFKTIALNVGWNLWQGIHVQPSKYSL